MGALALLICFDPELPTSHMRARMFAPDVGVEEDPATGSAAAALAGYLGVRDTATDGTLRWVVEQGFEMGRPSVLEVEADKLNGAISVCTRRRRLCVGERRNDYGIERHRVSWRNSVSIPVLWQKPYPAAPLPVRSGR